MTIEELGDCRIGADPVGQLDQAVTFVFEPQILDRLTAFTQAVDYLLGLADRHARIVGAMDHH